MKKDNITKNKTVRIEDNFDAIDYVRKERENLSKKFLEMTNYEILQYLKASSAKSTLKPSA